MSISLNSFVADELAHKVYILSKALNEIEQINATIEKENKYLKDILINLMSINNEDLEHTVSNSNDRLCTF
jgi:glycerol-3-phosphate dehydrogenase